MFLSSLCNLNSTTIRDDGIKKLFLYDYILLVRQCVFVMIKLHIARKHTNMQAHKTTIIKIHDDMHIYVMKRTTYNLQKNPHVTHI